MAKNILCESLLCAFLSNQLWQSGQDGQSVPIKHPIQKFAIVGDCDLKSFTVVKMLIVKG